MISCAPPGMTSSAGWKISRTPRPAAARAWLWVARASPAPTGRRSYAGRARRRGRRPRSSRPTEGRSARGSGRRVEVGAQGDPVCGFRRSEVDDHAAAVQQGRGQAGGGQPVGDDPAGPRLEAGELGVGVEVPTQTDELGFELVDGGVQHGKQWVHVGGQGYPADQYAPPMVSGPAFVVSAMVAEALADGRGVVALESTILAHGLPERDNRRVADEIEDAVRARRRSARDGGGPRRRRAGRAVAGRAGPAVPAGRRAQAEQPRPRRRRRARPDRRHHGGLDRRAWPHRAGIRVFATGGLGGVHRGARGDLRRSRPTSGCSPDAGARGLRRREVDPRRAGHAGAAGDAVGPGAGVPDRRLPRVLPHRLRLDRPLAGRVRGGGGGRRRTRALVLGTDSAGRRAGQPAARRRDRSTRCCTTGSSRAGWPSWRGRASRART